MRSLPVIAAVMLVFFLITVPVSAAPAEGGFVKSVNLGHGAVTMLSMTSDGSFVSAATQDGSILLLSRNTGPVWTYYNTKSNTRNAVAAVHPLGTRVIGATGSAVYFISDTGRELWSDQRLSQGTVYDVGISTDGYAFSTAGNSFNFFDRNNNPIFSLKTASAAWRFAISPDGSFVALGTSDPDHRVYLYDRNQSLRFTYDPKVAVSDVDVSYRGSRIVAGAGSNLYVFSQNGALLGAFDCGSPLNGISMSRDGTRIAVGMQDGKVKIVSDEGTVLWQNQTTGRVYDVALSSDGTQLAVAADNSVWWFVPDIPPLNPGTTGDFSPGSLAISSAPGGASVFVDNIYRGVTPITLTGLSAGDHMVLLRYEGYTDWTATITAIPEKTVTLTATFAGTTPLPTHAPAPVAAVMGALALCVCLRILRRS